jgi:hypothetical protein
MEDHVHLLLEGMTDESDFKATMKVVRQRTAMAYRRVRGQRLWQDGYFDRVLRPGDDVCGSPKGARRIPLCLERPEGRRSRIDPMKPGWRQPWPILCCLLAGAAITLAACATSPAAPRDTGKPPDGKTMKIQGQLTSDGVECPAMKADNGAIYTLLGDLKGFKAGDRVIVEAKPVEISFCMQGTTVQVTQITRAPK